jgi:dolichol-phosphate mannosyltransferase
MKGRVASAAGPILVTGAAGFVGAAAVHALAARGARVHALVRPGSRTWRLAGVLGSAQPHVQLHCVDLTDSGAVRRTLAAIGPAVVLHLAAHGAYESQAESSRILTTNILGTLHLLEAAVASGVRLFINAGSSSEYGLKAEAMREVDRLDPDSVYAIGKAAQTHLCAFFARRHPEMAVATLRLFSVYGPWEELSRLIPTVIRRARAGLPLLMVAPEIARDFVFIDDVLRALLDFEGLRAVRGQAINLGSGVETTLRSLVETIQKLFGHRSEVVWGGMRPRPWDTTRWVSDRSRAADLLGWEPRVGLEEGLARTAEWIAATGGDDGTSDVRRAG